MIEGALRREVMREHQRKRGEGGSPTWDAAFSQVQGVYSVPEQTSGTSAVGIRVGLCARTN